MLRIDCSITCDENHHHNKKEKISFRAKELLSNACARGEKDKCIIDPPNQKENKKWSHPATNLSKNLRKGPVMLMVTHLLSRCHLPLSYVVSERLLETSLVDGRSDIRLAIFLALPERRLKKCPLYFATCLPTSITGAREVLLSVVNK